MQQLPQGATQADAPRVKKNLEKIYPYYKRKKFFWRFFVIFVSF
jgi:hypothetical protein